MILSVWTLLKLRFKFKPCRALINDNDKDAVNSLEHLIVHTMPQSADVILQSKITRTHRSCSNDTYQRVSTPRTIVTVKAYRFDGPYNSVVFVLYRHVAVKNISGTASFSIFYMRHFITRNFPSGWNETFETCRHWTLRRTGSPKLPGTVPGVHDIFDDS